MATFSELVRSLTKLTLGTGTPSVPADAIDIVPVASTYKLTVSNVSMGQATTLSIPDGGASTDTVVTQKAYATTLSGTTISAGKDATAGTFQSFPATTASGKLILKAVDSAGAFNTTISNASLGQSSVISIPDPGAATAKFLLDTGTNATATITTGTVTTLTSTTANLTNLKYGATPVAQVDPASCTISAAAGASNTATVTIQLKDGSGTNLARIVPFTVYASSAADGLTIASAASTGFSVASGGVALPGADAVTQQIKCISSATGGCVLSLLDTGKQTSYLVLVVAQGTKISAQLSAGSYGA